MGIFGALTTAVTGMRAQSFALENISGNIANSQTTAFKRDRHELRRSDSGQHPEQAARRQRDRELALDQHGAGRHPERLDRHLHGDQRRRLLRRAEAGQLRRQPPGLRRHRPLHPPRRLPARQERLSGQRRRLLPDGHSGRLRRPATWSAACRSCCSSRTTSCRRSRPRRSIIAPTSRAIRRRPTTTTPTLPGSELLQPGELLRQSDRRPAAARQDHRHRRRRCCTDALRR